MRNADYWAFPSEPDGWPKEFGLTKREYFAGLAMQAYMTGRLSQGQTPSDKEVAQEATAYADALLKELEK